jgi:hypothetical protein
MESDDNYKWTLFYKKLYDFEVKEFTPQFSEDAPKFDIIFNINEANILPTIAPEHTHKLVNIIHHKFRTRPNERYIDIRRRANNDNHYAMPILNMNTNYPKYSEINNRINIAIIGGADEYNYNIINRICVDPYVDTKLLHFHIVSREMNNDATKNIKQPFTTYEGLETESLIELVSQCDYILIDVKLNNIERIFNKYAITGGIILAWTFAVPLILSYQTNKYLQYKNCIVFDQKDHKLPILLRKITQEALYKERDEFPSIETVLMTHYPDLLN